MYHVANVSVEGLFIDKCKSMFNDMCRQYLPGVENDLECIHVNNTTVGGISARLIPSFKGDVLSSDKDKLYYLGFTLVLGVENCGYLLTLPTFTDTGLQQFEHQLDVYFDMLLPMIGLVDGLNKQYMHILDDACSSAQILNRSSWMKQKDVLVTDIHIEKPIEIRYIHTKPVDVRSSRDMCESGLILPDTDLFIQCKNQTNFGYLVWALENSDHQVLEIVKSELSSLQYGEVMTYMMETIQSKLHIA